jgi:hypothetical protein
MSNLPVRIWEARNPYSGGESEQNQGMSRARADVINIDADALKYPDFDHARFAEDSHVDASA